MAKPICLIKVQKDNQPEDIITRLNEILRDRMPDYYVFVIPQEDYTEHHDALEFQVFYEKDFTEIQYAELKQLVESYLNPLNL